MPEARVLSWRPYVYAAPRCLLVWVLFPSTYLTVFRLTGWVLLGRLDYRLSRPNSSSTQNPLSKLEPLVQRTYIFRLLAHFPPFLLHITSCILP